MKNGNVKVRNSEADALNDNFPKSHVLGPATVIPPKSTEAI